MLTIYKAVTSLKLDRRGVTALEYAIIAGVMGLVLVAAFTKLGTNISTMFTALEAKM